MKLLNSNIFQNQISNKLGLEDLKLNKIYDALNPLIEEEQKRKAAEEKERKAAKARAEIEKKEALIKKTK